MRNSLSNSSNSLYRNNSMTPAEYEVEALSSIYGENLEKDPKSTNIIRVFLRPDPLAQKDPLCWIKLQVCYNKNYPKVMPDIEIVDKYNISKKELQTINEEIDNIAFSKSSENSEMIFDICRYIEQFLEEKIRIYDKKNDYNLRKLSVSDSENQAKKRKWSKLCDPESPKAAKVTLESHSNTKEIENTHYIRNFLKEQECLHAENSDYKIVSSKNIHENTEFDLERNIDFNKKISGSRLKSDFQIVEKIGQGGGGAVYKVLHNIDKQYYAIKKIKIHTKKSPDKILKEVMLLSRLQHPNIVRYYQAWYEDSKNFDEDDDDIEEYEINSDEESKQSSSKNLSRDSEEIQPENSNDHYLVFEKEESSKAINIWNSSENSPKNDQNSENIKNNNSLLSPQSQNKNSKKSETKYLIIQMEFCEGQSLREAIDKNLLKDEKVKWKVIIQIIDALNYIHRKRLIHRDIKPANIFLDKKFNVKLGDFGLATVSKPKTALENLSLNKKEYINFRNDILSCGIGTKYYCSPEQEKKNKYDEKTDMFSLGIVIFELFFSFGSLMERDIILRNIKDQHKFPQKFQSASPDAVQIVNRLTDTDPKIRPSSYELLNSSLVSRNYNEKTVLDNLQKMMEENHPFSLKVVELSLKEVKGRIDQKDDDYEFDNLEDQLFTIVNHEENLDNIFYSKLAKLNHLGQLNIRSFPFIFYILDKIVKNLKKKFNKEGGYYLNFGEIQKYNKLLPVYDSFYSKIIHIDQNYDDVGDGLYDQLMLTSTGHLVNYSKNIYNNLARFVRHFYSHSSYIAPLKIYSDFTSINCQNSIREEINYNLIWIGNKSKLFENKKSKNIFKIIPDDDYIYEQTCIETLLQSLENMELDENIEKILIINSTKIIDQLFLKIGFESQDKETISQKYQTIKFLSEMSTSIRNVKELMKILESEPKRFRNLLINKQKFKDFLYLIDISGDLETIYKKLDKKNDLINHEIFEINQSLFKSLNKLTNLKIKIKIDFSLMPSEMVNYSGVFFQVLYQEQDGERIKICEGGRYILIYNF
jgi:serine/threonine protein kinase